MKTRILLIALLFCFKANAIYFDEGAIEEGYRGFTDFSYGLGVGDGNGCDRITLTSSHGYQIASLFYVGAGIGFNYFHDSDDVSMPVFAHFRSDFLDNDITPFAEMRVGYSFFDVKGFYLNPAVGCRFSVTDNFAMNLSIGYTMQKSDVYTWYSYGYYWGTERMNLGSVDFRFGIEF